MRKSITGDFTILNRNRFAGSKLTVATIILLLLAVPAAQHALAQSISPDTGPGPVRLARVSYVSGTVSFRPSEQGQWSNAVRNLPLRQGAELTASGDGRTEIQFDDGSRLRLGDGAIATLAVMYSDSKGEYTQISLKSGEGSLRLMKAPSVYEVDTPTASVDVSGPARLWIDARSGLQTSVLQGSAVVQGKGGKVTLVSHNTLNLAVATDPYVAEPLAPADTFDTWCSTLDETEDHDLRDPHRAYVPGNVAIMSDNLDNYGSWRTVPKYGRVWHPYHCYAGWRPYHDGHWVWVDPYGWTWVGAEPWGWAPYHYGTWVDEPWGWCWDPGPPVQYWSPAVVDFYCGGLNIAWCPLAPAECFYPAGISIGFGGPNWWLSFGIGACAVWYPGVGGICRPYAWGPGFINRSGFGGGVGGWGGINHNGFVGGRGYVPINARGAAGASMASVSGFGGRGAYRSLPAGSRSAFSGGQFVGAPARGASPAAGPASARPTALSASATRSLRADPPASVSRAALSRSVNHTASAAQSPAAARQTVAQSAAATRNGSARTAGSARSVGAATANRTATSAGARTAGARTAVNTAGARGGGTRNTANSAARANAARTAANGTRAASPNRAQTAANNARSTLGLPRSNSTASNRVASSSRMGRSAQPASATRNGASAGTNRRTASSVGAGSARAGVRTASANRTRSTSGSAQRTASNRVASRSRATSSSAGRASFSGSHGGARSSSITRSAPQRSSGGGRSFGGGGGRSFGGGGSHSIGGGGRSFGGGGHSIGGGGFGGGHSVGGGGGHSGGGGGHNRR